MVPSHEFAGRTVLITGASGGIGAALARAFAAEAADLVLVDLRRPADSTGPMWVEGDLRDPETVRRAISTAIDSNGRLDVVVNAAGVQVRKPAADIEEDEWQNLLAINLSSAFALCRAVAPALRQSHGSIINIGSLSATRVLPDIVPYGATKAALTQLSNGLAEEFGPQGIRVNTIAPGHIRTPMTERKLTTPETRDALLPQIPLRRFGTAEEVADAAVFLASDRAAYISGATLAVDGGCSVS